MKQVSKLKMLLGILLLVCVASVASDNYFIQEKGAKQESASVMAGGLTFNNVPLTLQVGTSGTVTANIPLGYDKNSLKIEPNEYCLTIVNGNAIMVTAIKSIGGGVTTIRATVSPLSTTRSLRDISGEFTVYVTGK